MKNERIISLNSLLNYFRGLAACSAIFLGLSLSEARLHAQCFTQTWPYVWLFYPSSGNPQLDTAIVQEAANISYIDQLPSAPALWYFDDSSGANCLAAPIDFPEYASYPTVYLGFGLLSETFAIPDQGGYAVAGIMAHEFGHISQIYRNWNSTSVFRELHADFLAGYYLYRKWLEGYAVSVSAVANSLYMAGDSPFSLAAGHGTGLQRVACMLAGFNAGVLSFNDAYYFGLQVVTGQLPPPYNLAASVRAYTNAILVHWTSPGLTTSFTVLASPDPYFYSPQIFNVGTATSFVHTNLLPGRVYYYSVYRTFAGFNSPATPAVAGYTRPMTRIIGLAGNLNFGSVPAGHTATRTLVITNGGYIPLDVSAVSFPPAFSGAWSGSIPSFSSQGIPVTFAPGDQTTYGGAVMASSDATGGSPTSLVSGTGYWPLTNSWTLWFQHTNGTAAAWFMSGPNATLGTHLNPANGGAGWRIMATTDLDLNGQPDLLFENPHGAVAAWLMDGTNRLSAAYLTPSSVDPRWQIRATGDTFGNGGKQVLWQCVDGRIASWQMDGLVCTQSIVLSTPWADTNWHLAATADLNGDVRSDIVWQHTDGRIAVSFMQGTSRLGTSYLNPARIDPSWKIVGALDLNGDGHPGLIWRHDTGTLAYWQMAGTNLVHSGYLNPTTLDPAWKIVGPK